MILFKSKISLVIFCGESCKKVFNQTLCFGLSFFDLPRIKSFEFELVQKLSCSRNGGSDGMWGQVAALNLEAAAQQPLTK